MSCAKIYCAANLKPKNDLFNKMRHDEGLRELPAVITFRYNFWNALVRRRARAREREAREWQRNDNICV